MLLDIQNIDISYGDKLTVQDFNLQLGEGKICSLVGESGSGKTTVIRAVLGLLPGAGKVHFPAERTRSISDPGRQVRRSV